MKGIRMTKEAFEKWFKDVYPQMGDCFLTNGGPAFSKTHLQWAFNGGKQHFVQMLESDEMVVGE